MDTTEKNFPEDMVPLGDKEFTFSCHEGVECYMTCCRNVNMFLYPYDVLRLKNRLGISSETFMHQYTRIDQGPHPYFPAVMLKLVDDEKKSCPFLGADGCTVYSDRPSACRTYPLEMAIDRTPGKRGNAQYYFLTQHPYCFGHKEKEVFTAKTWVRNQRIDDYNMMSELYTEVDSIFATNPWKGEGIGGSKQQMAFMVCYNIDGFKSFIAQKKLLAQFKLSKDQKRRILKSDSEVLKFGFEWLKLILTGRSSLVQR